MAKIVVVGSINMDIVNQVQEHPKLGETVHAVDTQYHTGGKGANQAVAAHRAGGRVQLVAAVGDDEMGSTLVNHMKNIGLETDNIIRKAGMSGIAFITVGKQGENHIILSAGANQALSTEDLHGLKTTLQDADAIILQNEIPLETSCFAMKVAHQRGVRVFFNPAPAVLLPNEAYASIDVMILNETEAAVITGVPVKNPDDAKLAADVLLQRGVREVIVTLGEKGALYADTAQSVIYTPAFPTQAVDTTAAGDTFIGAFVAYRSSGNETDKALRFASAASAITVSRHGAQDSIPTKAEITSYLIAAEPLSTF
ncbi:ribokinase [Alicyclobacillus fodiniaquatilis]|uniref:Ribokinase n=1 Tax=Alicyclobacillus fodiniaquatilis TaxID=1661150 RepID=A0ABW4JQ27_9BACL